MLSIDPYTAPQLHAAIDELTELLCNTVDSGAAIGFMPPLAVAIARDYWRQVGGDLARGTRVLLAARRANTIVGTVQLELATKPNGLHRAEVQKLMVDPRARRQGIGRELMIAVDAAARAAGRTLLVLDTREGDAAEQLYLAQGYTPAGRIPHYARSADGSLHTTVLFYRLLS
jgi:ribosomal protein S18 acetylase RimI-like enzyme